MWDDVQRFWAEEVEEPSRAAPSVRSGRGRLSRVPADLPAAVVADQDTSLWAAWERLRGADCRHLVVVDSEVRPVGELEERDLALRWPPGPFQADRIPLRQVVRGQARAQARTGDDVAGVARAMLTARTDAVPVVDDDGRLVGLVTARQWTELVAGHPVR